MSERRHTRGTSSERIEKAAKIGADCALQPDTGLMDRPLVSVSITTYQHADFIRQCLDSVLMQETTFPFEILLGEDESTDGTREICQEYADKHPDLIRLFLHKREDNLEINGRATGRLNLLNNLQQAKGKYIALLDGDDYWTDPKKLQIQFDALEEDPEAAGCFHDCLIVDEETQSSRASIGNRKIDPRPDLGSLIRENNIRTSSMFFRNVIDLTEPPDLFFVTVMGDYVVGLMVADKGDWIYLDRAMSVYRVHLGGLWSISQTQETYCRESVGFFENLAKWRVPQIIRTRVVSSYKLSLRRLATAEAREGKVISSLRHFWMSLGSKDRTGSKYINFSRYLWALLAPMRSAFSIGQKGKAIKEPPAALAREGGHDREN